MCAETRGPSAHNIQSHIDFNFLILNIKKIQNCELPHTDIKKIGRTQSEYYSDERRHANAFGENIISTKTTFSFMMCHKKSDKNSIHGWHACLNDLLHI